MAAEKKTMTEADESAGKSDAFVDAYRTAIQAGSRRSIILIGLFVGYWIVANNWDDVEAFKTRVQLDDMNRERFFSWTPIIYFIFVTWLVHAQLLRLRMRSFVHRLMRAEKELGGGTVLAYRADLSGGPEFPKPWLVYGGLFLRFLVVLLPLALMYLLHRQLGKVTSVEELETVEKFIVDRQWGRWTCTVLGTTGLLLMWTVDFRQIRSRPETD